MTAYDAMREERLGICWLGTVYVQKQPSSGKVSYPPNAMCNAFKRLSECHSDSCHGLCPGLQSAPIRLAVPSQNTKTPQGPPPTGYLTTNRDYNGRYDQ